MLTSNRKYSQLKERQRQKALTGKRNYRHVFYAPYRSSSSNSSSTDSEPSSSRNGSILQRSARKAAGRLAVAKRTSGIILALAEGRSMLMREHKGERKE